MSKLLSLAATALLLVGLAGVGHAAPLKWEGTLSVHLDTMSAFAAGTGLSTVNGSGGTGHLNTLALAPGANGGLATTISDTQGGTGVTQIIATITNGPSGTPFAGNTGVGAALYGGSLKLFFMAGGGNPVTLNANVVGSPGASTTGTANAGQTVVTIFGAGWSTGVVTAMSGAATVSSTGFAHGPASGTTSTATRSGVIKLVTPVQVSTNITGHEALALFVDPKIRFVPEPGLLLLIGSGVVGLVVFGRRRIQR